jgi:CRP-like cAMP-binding protein
VSVPDPRAEQALARLPLFKETPPDAVRELASRAEWVRLEAGDVLYRQGEPLEPHALLLVTGRLMVWAEAGGQRHARADVWPGEIVGEAGLYTRNPTRSATVTAVVPSVGLRVSRDLFVALGEHPACVALEVNQIRTMARRIDVAGKTLQRATATTRVATPSARPAPAAAAAPTLAQRFARFFGGGS